MASNPPGKQKSPIFPINKIIIGQWNRVSTYPDSLVAKCYLGEKKLIWEILDDDAPIGIQRLKKKIQIRWDDVLSIRVDPSSPGGTEILHVELSKPPTFYMETERKPLIQTRWEKTDQDFTLNQASTCRRHTLHFPRGILHENMKILTSANKFWSDIINKPFPTLPNSIYFEQTENINHVQTISSSVNNHQSQEGNFSMATQLWPNYGRQINSSVQSHSENISPYQFLVAQNNEQGSRGGFFLGQHYDNRLVQAGTIQMRNTVHPFLGAQTTSQLSNELFSRRGDSQFGNRLVQADMNQMRNIVHQLPTTSQLSNELCIRRGDSQFGNRLVQAGTNQMRNTAHQLLEKPLFLGSQTDCEFVFGNSNSKDLVTHTWYDDGSYFGQILDEDNI